MSRYNTFIMRIWSGEDLEFHGRIIHVQTREEYDFRTLERALEFISKHVQALSGDEGTAARATQPHLHRCRDEPGGSEQNG